MKILVIACFLFSILFNVHANSADIPGQMSVEILDQPIPLKAEGKYYLVYELHVVNYHKESAEITSLEVNKDNQNQPIFKYNEEALRPMIYDIGNDPKTKNSTNATIFKKGTSKIIFMWLPFQNINEIPEHLTHNITLKTQHDNKVVTLTIETDPLKVNQAAEIIVSPPLRGNHWAAWGGPSNNSYHRRANVVINGQDYFAQRYAIDFVKIGPDGKTYHDNAKNNENYYCYGQDIHAVAEGTVVAIKDGIKENIPQSEKKAVPINLETAGGNHIVIEIEKDRYAFYAHLIPGSLQVKKGDIVKTGQILGKVGNSGNSSEPHLHFHIVDKPSFLGANGLPFGFNTFKLFDSQLISDEPSFQVRILKSSPKNWDNQLMLDNAVINF